MRLLSCLKSGLLTVSLAVVSSILVAPSFAEPFFNVTFSSLGTDQDVYPANYPYSYTAAQTLVLDMTSSGYISQPYLQLEFPDITAERQLNGFRSVMREMYDLQTLSSPDIRTRDLSSPYTTALSEFCGYYLVSGAVYPVTGIPNAAECNPPVAVVVAPEPPAPQPAFIPAPAPVPALW
jgi:hypothetical protein